MAGLADLFGGGAGGMFGGGSLYGDMLSPEQKQALAFRGLMSAAGALGQAAMPSRMPIPIGAALGQAAGAMAQGQDEGAMSALRASLVGLQGQQLKSDLTIRESLLKALGLSGGAGGTPSSIPTTVPATNAPADTVVPSGGLTTGGALTKPGGVTLADAKAAALRAGFDEDGANTIAAITVPESSLNPNAYNPNDPNGGSFGLTQINGVHPGAREAIGNPDKAMELAFRVSKGGKDFSPWSAYTSGAYKPYLAEAAGIAVPTVSGDGAPQGPLVIPAAGAVTQRPLTAKDVTTNFGGPKTQKLADGTLVSEDDFPYFAGVTRGTVQIAPASAQSTPTPQIQGPAAAPQIRLAQNGSAPTTPAAPVFGSLAPQPVTPAVPNMQMGSVNLNDPKNVIALGVLGDMAKIPSLGTLLTGTPQYKAAVAAAEKWAGVAPAYAMPDANPTLQGQIAGSKKGGEYPYVALEAALKADLERRNQLAQQGAQLGPGGTVAPVPGFAETIAGTKGAQASAEEAAKAAQEMTTVLVAGPDGKPQERQMTRAQAVRLAQGMGVPELGIPPSQPMPSPAPEQRLNGLAPMIPPPPPQDGIAPPAPERRLNGLAPMVPPPPPAAVQPGGAVQGGIVGKPYFTPAETTGQQNLATSGVTALDNAHAAELAANRRTQSLGQMAEAMKGFTPGATAEMQLGARRILKDLGIPGMDNDKVPPAEIFQQAARHLQIVAAPRGQGSVSNYERELFGQAVPAMTNSPESLTKAIDIAKRLDDYDRAVAQIHRDVAKQNGGLPNYIEAQQRIAALGPPLSPGEMGALEAVRQGQVPAGGTAPPATSAITKEQYDKLPPGTAFTAPDGTRRIKPGGP